MAESKLEIIISARDEQFRQSMNRLRKEGASTGKALVDSFEFAGGKMEDALESVSFQALADEARNAAATVKKSFDKTGNDLKAAFAQAEPKEIFDGAAEAAKELIAQAERLKTELGKAFEKGEYESVALRAALDKLDAALKEVGEDGKRSGDRVEEALRGVVEASSRAASSTDDLGDSLNALNVSQLADKVSEFTQGIAGAASAALGTFSSAGDEVRAFEDRVKSAYTAAADQQVIIKAGEDIRDTFRGAFSLEAVGESAQVFKRFGADAQQAAADLARAAKVAKTEGRDLAAAVEPLAEALRSDGSFDAGVFEEISVQLGIGGAALEQYGAKVDENKKVIAETAEEQRRAQDALRAYIDENERYAGVAERTKTAYGEAQAEVAKFNAGVGEQINEVKELAAEAVLPLLRLINELPDSFKLAAVGGTTLLAAGATLTSGLAKLYGIAKLLTGTGGLAGIGAATAGAGAATAAGTATMAAGAAEVEAAFLAASGQATVAGTAAAGTATAIAGVGAVAVVAAVGINEYTKGLIDAEEAEQDLQDTLSRAGQQAKQFIAFREASVDAIKAQTDAIVEDGERRAALSAAINQKENALQDAQQAGDTAKAGRLEAQIQSLREIREETDLSIKATVEGERAAAQAVEERFRKAGEAFEKFKKGSEGTKANQANFLQGLIPDLKGDQLDGAREALKKLNEDIAGDRIESLQKVAQAEGQTGEQLLNQARALLNEYQVQGEKRIEIEQKVEDAAKALDEQRAQRRRALAAEELDLQRNRLALEARDGEATDAKIEALQATLDKGKDVIKELERELKGRAENQKRLLEQEAALDRIAVKQKANADAANEPDKSNRQQIYDNAAERESQLNKRVAQDKAAVDRQLAKDQEALSAKQAANAKKKADDEKAASAKSLELEARKADLALATYEQQRQAQEDTFAERQQQLEEEVSLGQATAAELLRLDEERNVARKAAIAEQTKLEIEAINKRADAEKAGKSTAEQALVASEAELEIEKARAQAKRDTAAIVNQSQLLKKQELADDLAILQALKDQNGERKKAQGFKSTFKAGAQTVEEAFGQNLSGFGVSRRDYEDGEARAEDGRTQAEIERDIARKRGMLNSEQNRQDGRNGSSSAENSGSTFGKSRSQRTAERESAATPGPVVDPMSSAQGDQLLQLMASLVQVGQSLGRRSPSTFGMNFERGGSRTEGT